MRTESCDSRALVLDTKHLLFQEKFLSSSSYPWLGIVFLVRLLVIKSLRSYFTLWASMRWWEHRFRMTSLKVAIMTSLPFKCLGKRICSRVSKTCLISRFFSPSLVLCTVSFVRTNMNTATRFVTGKSIGRSSNGSPTRRELISPSHSTLSTYSWRRYMFFSTNSILEGYMAFNLAWRIMRNTPSLGFWATSFDEPVTRSVFRQTMADLMLYLMPLMVFYSNLDAWILCLIPTER